jgi:2-oxoglutarate ferredoxin oxidoreductase subunit delta
MVHGRIEIDVERCKGCELCRSACPHHVIKLSDSHNNKGHRPAVLVDPEHKCTGCGLCAIVCPDTCITVYRIVDVQAHSQSKEVLHHGHTIA